MKSQDLEIAQVKSSAAPTTAEADHTMMDELDVDETKRGENNGISLARVVPSIKNSGVTMRTSNNLNLYSRPGPVENHDLL